MYNASSFHLAAIRCMRYDNNTVYTLYSCEEGLYIEKKSRFIADLFYVEKEEEAEDALAFVRKKHYDARHHCQAMILGDPKDGRSVMRSSDDGEPQGTAGHPMLDVLMGQDIGNVLAVVTRYFGGTLLGTGGLVRSYTKALQDALERSTLIERKQGMRLRMAVPYEQSGKIEHFIRTQKIPVLGTEYGEMVEFHVICPDGMEESLPLALGDMLGGKRPEEEGVIDYALHQGKVLTGEALYQHKGAAWGT